MTETHIHFMVEPGPNIVPLVKVLRAHDPNRSIADIRKAIPTARVATITLIPASRLVHMYWTEEDPLVTAKRLYTHLAEAGFDVHLLKESDDHIEPLPLKSLDRLIKDNEKERKKMLQRNRRSVGMAVLILPESRSPFNLIMARIVARRYRRSMYK